MTLTRNTVLIGEGIPFFGPMGHDIQLHHRATRWFANGFVQSNYSVQRYTPIGAFAHWAESGA